MDKTVERKSVRVYCFQLPAASNANWPEIIRVHADVMCESGGKIALKREGQIVGEISVKVYAWWIEEIPSVDSSRTSDS